MPRRSKTASLQGFETGEAYLDVQVGLDVAQHDVVDTPVVAPPYDNLTC
jgi:hypothetical protein